MEVDCEPGIEIIIGSERRTINCRLMHIVVHKLGKRQEVCPIVLLIVTIDSKVLLDSFVHTLYLTVDLGVKCGR